MRGWLIALDLVLVTTVAASAEEPGGLQRCIASNIKDGRLMLSHAVGGAGDVISRNEWLIRCDGATALAAWDQLYGLRRDDPVEMAGPNGTRLLVLKLGATSSCAKVVDGSRARCEISLDIAAQFQAALRQ